MSRSIPSPDRMRARDMSAMQRYTGHPDVAWVGVILFEGTLASA